jgi:hypothetical protein
MSVVAATAAVALALSAGAAASASPVRASHAAAPALSLPPSPPGAPAGLKPLAPIIIEGNADTSGIIGYAICLRHDTNHCASDLAPYSAVNYSAANLKRPANTAVVVLENIGSGIIVWGIQVLAKGVIKWIKKYKYNGKHFYSSPGDGLCSGAWGYDQDVTLGNCNSAHGIYWQWHSNGQMWNTYSSGFLIAANTNNGTDLFVHSPEDWSTWGYRDVCVNSC